MTTSHNQGHGGHEGHGAAQPGGLLVSEHGYTLELDTPILSSGTQTVAFWVTGPDGRAVTDFDPAREKELHFIAIRRDTTGFQHVHPAMDPSGRWNADLNLTPGVWRLFADFHPAGHGPPMTLGIDASVAGEYDPQPLPGITRTTEVGDYTVTLSGTLASGEASELTFSVQRNGKSVTDLQPYLGAYGHLVALRGGDLAYLHVHPEGEPSDGTTAPGPDIAFIAAAPSTGSYRLHLDFQHEDIVRTAQINGFGRQQRPRFRPPERPQPGSPSGRVSSQRWARAPRLTHTLRRPAGRCQHRDLSCRSQRTRHKAVDRAVTRM